MAREAMIAIRVEAAVREAVAKAAAEDGRSMSQWIERLITARLKATGHLPK